MKKIFASAGLIALGASTVATKASELSLGTAEKPWDVRLSVRGFYDDNYNTAPNGPARKDSFGVELKPSLGAAWHRDQTSFGGRYTYSMRYYEARPNGQIDHAHDLNLWMVHNFSERFTIDVADTFTVAQEPTITDPTLSTVTRTKGDNIHNNGNINFHAQLTRALELVVGFKNDLYIYDQKGFTNSLSAQLDRMESAANADLRWRFLPETVGVFGYAYGWGDYDSSDMITDPTFPFILHSSKEKNFRSHFVYTGVDHAFLRNLTGSVRVGAQFTDYYNAQQDNVSPWVDSSLRYTYGTDSYLEAGFVHRRNATDAFSLFGTSITTDQETSTFFTTWQHAITARLTGTLTGQYSHATYNGGSLDGQSDDIYLFGASAEYHFTRHLSAEVGYNYDRVESNTIGRGYDRNRVFIGMNATY